MRDSDDVPARPPGAASGRGPGTGRWAALRDAVAGHSGGAALRGALAARRSRLVIITIAAIAALSAGTSLLVACSGGGGTSAAFRPAGANPKPSPAAQLSISPASGRSGVSPNARIRVTARHARLSKIKVTAGGAPVSGRLSHSGTSWRPTWPLHTATRYRVTATGTGADGKPLRQVSTFRTLTPAGTYSVTIFEGLNQTYGVGMPVMLTFSQPVTRKYAVEKALQLRTSKRVNGAWYWDGDQTLVFRPENYWPQNTEVTFKGHFDGLRIAPGVYGTANLTQHFRIGASLITVASTRTHYMQVFYQHKKIGNWPISTGRPDKPTANGTYLTIEKGNPTRMKGHGYNVLVPFAVRFTWSGNYIHDAWWSVAQQGHVNVSHGCVNVSPAHSKVYYRLAHPGDPVTVVGSPAAGKWDDGWTYWFLSWHQLLRGSATHLAVKAGPDGSRFVSPGSLPAPAASRLRGSRSANYTSS